MQQNSASALVAAALAVLFLASCAAAGKPLKRTPTGFECNGKSLSRYLSKKANLNVASVTCDKVSRRRLQCQAFTEEMPGVAIPFTLKCKGRGWNRPSYGSADDKTVRAANAIIAGLVIENLSPKDTSAGEISRALAKVIDNPAIKAKDIDILGLEEGSIEVVLALNAQGASSDLTCALYAALGGPTGGVFGALLTELQQLNSNFENVEPGQITRAFFGCPKCNLAACDNAFPTTTLEPSSEPSPEPFEAGDYTIMLFPSDPTCGGDFANLNTSTALVAESKKLNECVPCLACGGLTTLVEVLEPCAPGVTLYSTRHANLETCLAADAPPGPAVEESPVSFGGCRELTTRPGLFSKSLCGTPADNLCSLEGPRRTLLVGNFYQGEECDTLVPRGSFWVFADGQGCAALSPGLWSRTSIVGDVACSEATEYTRSIHTDAQCTSAPVPSLSGTFPLGGCNFPDPLSGGNFGSILRCVCE